MKTILSFLALPLLLWVAADLNYQESPRGTKHQDRMDLRTTLKEYPLDVGEFWEYRFTETFSDDFAQCQAAGTTTLKIEDVQEGVHARVARGRKMTVSSSIKSTRPRQASSDSHCESIGGDSDLPWTIVMVPGKVYEGTIFAEDLISRVLREGSTPMEERGIQPNYAFPLEVGATWTSDRNQYRIAGSGPVNTTAGLFSQCFNLVSRTEGTNKQSQEWFCRGVGVVQGHYEVGNSVTDFALRSFVTTPQHHESGPGATSYDCRPESTIRSLTRSNEPSESVEYEPLVMFPNLFVTVKRGRNKYGVQDRHPHLC
jgi:hypothetical protein